MSRDACKAAKVRVRLLLARWEEGDTPTVVASIDQTIWEHWDDEDEAAWIAEGKRQWGIDPSDCEWKEVWAELPAGALTDAFTTPTVTGEVGPFFVRDCARLVGLPDDALMDEIMERLRRATVADHPLAQEVRHGG